MYFFQQECTNTNGSFQCSCVAGYQLSSDGTSCEPCPPLTYGIGCSKTCQCNGRSLSCNHITGDNDYNDDDDDNDYDDNVDDGGSGGFDGGDGYGCDDDDDGDDDDDDDGGGDDDDVVVKPQSMLHTWLVVVVLLMR
jgi:hypothetical protein